MLHALNPDEHLIQMPLVTGPRTTAAQAFGKTLAKFLAPAPNCLIGYDDATLGQQQLNIPQAEAKDPAAFNAHSPTVWGCGLAQHVFRPPARTPTGKLAGRRLCAARRAKNAVRSQECGPGRPGGTSGRAGDPGDPRTKLSYWRIRRFAEIRRARGCRRGGDRPAMRCICPERFSRPSLRDVAMDTGRIAPEDVPRRRYGDAERIGADRVQRVLTRRHVEVQPARLRVALRPGLGIDATMRARRD